MAIRRRFIRGDPMIHEFFTCYWGKTDDGETNVVFNGSVCVNVTYVEVVKDEGGGVVLLRTSSGGFIRIAEDYQKFMALWRDALVNRS
jgi:hypothetical protein